MNGKARYPRTHGGYVCAEVDVEIDIDDVIGQIETKTLIEELQRRDVNASLNDSILPFIDEALLLIKTSDFTEAELVLERAARPRFASMQDAAKALNIAMGKDQ